jgi:hypothetical protein
VHLDGDDAVALTGFAAAAFDVEREAARTEPARLGIGIIANRSRMNVNNPCMSPDSIAASSIGD